MTNMKRSYSDSESEDGFDEPSKPGSPSQSGQGPDRKKRRGIIEKRRRDRINNSLSELRRLVPAAFEKQGSAKLEKAEILQMTVDHLKVLHSKGLNGYNLDTAALAMDYRSVGYRECAAEVARYMVAMEGMDIQDPLRLRLLSHLQCYGAQREAATKARLQGGSAWTSVPSSAHTMNPQYNGAAAVGAMSSAHAHAAMISQHPPGGQPEQLGGMTTHNGLSGVSPYPEPNRLDNGHSAAGAGMASVVRLSGGGGGGGGGMTSQMSTAHNGGGSSSITTCSSSHSPMSHPSSMLSTLPPQMHSQFPVSALSAVNSMPGMLSPNGGHNYNPSTTLGSHMKPYRPWGAELVY